MSPASIDFWSSALSCLVLAAVMYSLWMSL